MDKGKLRQFRDLSFEIKKLNKRIEKLKRKSAEHDFVTGSNAEFPYQQVRFEIEGLVDNSTRIKSLEAILHKRLETLEDLELDIERWISSIDDSRIRLVMTMRYIEGRSWVYISRQFGSCNESYARMIHDRYLEKNQKTIDTC